MQLVHFLIVIIIRSEAISHFSRTEIKQSAQKVTDK